MAVLTRHKSTVYGLVTDLTNIQNAIGLTNSLTYQPVTGASYISTATSVKNATDFLDAALKTTSDNLAAEVTRATNAEATLTTNLAAEVTRATNAEATLTTNLAAEVTRAIAAETAISTTLSADLDAEVTRATTAEATLTTNLAAEVTRATSAETTLTTNLAAEVTRATTAEATLTTNLAAEVTARTNADSSLQTSLDNEVTARTNADTSLNNAITAEAGTRLQADTDLSDALALEVQSREAADLVHTQDIAARVKLAGDTMSGDLDFNAIYTVKGLREPALPGDAATKNYVDALAAGLSWQEPVESVGTVLPATAAIGDRFLNTADGKIYTSTDVDTWDTGVLPEDGYALFDRDNETGYVYSGTSWVQFTGTGQITAGVGLSKTANVININLGAGIAELPSDEVSVDLFTAGGLFLTVDGSTEDATAAAQIAIKLDGETITRTASGIKVADAQILRISTLETGLTTEIADRSAADTLIQSNLDNEVTNRTAADGLLQSSIDTEVTRATAAEATLTTNLAAEVTRASAAELAVQTNLAAEVTRATAAEGTLTTNLAAEVTRATAAEGTLTTNLAAEVTRATAAEATLTAGLSNLSGVTDASTARSNIDVYSTSEVDLAIANGGSIFVTEVTAVASDSITLAHTPKNGVIFNFATVRHTDANFVSYDIPVAVGATANVFNLSPNSAGEFDGKDVVVQYAYVPSV